LSVFKKETKSSDAVLLWMLIFLIFFKFSYKREAEYLLFGSLNKSWGIKTKKKK
jgi:hypothetical protein